MKAQRVESPCTPPFREDSQGSANAQVGRAISLDFSSAVGPKDGPKTFVDMHGKHTSLYNRNTRKFPCSLSFQWC